MHMRKLISILTLAALGWSSAVVRSEWQPAKGPLLTRWAKDVSPAHALVEYPRPQLARAEWLNLNGLWQFAEARDGDEAPVGRELPGQILVPFPVESALSGVMKQMERMWYRRTFQLPASFAGQRALLHFGAVDWEATVYVNGQKLGEHRGGYDAFSFDITDALKPEGPQELVVGVFDPSDAGNQPRGKQVRNPGGIMYTPASGIWQTAWLEPVAPVHIEALKIQTEINPKTVTVRASITPVSGEIGVRVAVFEGGRKITEAQITQSSDTAGPVSPSLALALPEARLWSPAQPNLYDLKVTLYQRGQQVDEVTSYFGLRKVEVARDAQGINRLLLNGEFVMQVGPLDQGFWPDGIYSAPTDEALKYDIEITRKLGFNMTRKHVKVEPDRWYYWADKLGLLVWQDMPAGDNRTAEAKKQFELELGRLIQTHINHPSIIMWVVFNEGWGQFDTGRLTDWVKRQDPSRLVNNASGWTDQKVGDVNDIHAYPAPQSPPAEPGRAVVLGEFGGLGLAIPGHTWKAEHWGYQGMANQDQLTAKYETFLQSVYQFKDSPGLCAAVYTQITDVEVECNGLLTYDRAVIKPDLERIAAVNRGDFSRMPPPPIVTTVVPTSEARGMDWRYTFEKPGDGWFQPAFDASAWKRGPGGFGTKSTPGSVVRTEWNTADIWLRRDFNFPDREFKALQFRVHHDEDAELYINGVLAAKLGGYSTAYEAQPLTAEGRAVLKPGRNILAVHCRQTSGGQYIDAGLVDIQPVPPPRAAIDVNQVGEPISKYIYGQFIEHLGRCIYGGIWAEMLEDRKFFEAVGSKNSPWKPVGGPEAVAMVREKPFVGQHTPQVRLAGDGARRGFAQGALALKKGMAYTGRIWLAGDPGAGPVEVTLAWGSGPRDRQTVRIEKLGPDFARSPLNFTAGAATDDGRLEISAAGQGQFLVGTVSLMPADHLGGMRADTLQLLKELNSPVYRWPGGNFVSGYNWKDGIGDPDRRPPRKNPAWQGIEHNDFGLDEFMAFCRFLGTDPYLAVNSGLGDSQGAVDELQYANGAASTPMGAWRARNGHPEPYGIRFWSIGNEMYGDWQLGHMTQDKYIQKHNAFVDAMRAVDPSIKVVAVGDAGKWSENMMRGAADHMDLISEHFYCQERPGLIEHVQQIPRAAHAKAVAHQGYRRQLDSLKGKDIRIALDEWNYWYGPHVFGELGTRYFLKDALGIAAGLHEMARNSGLFYMANYAQTVNVIGCIKTSKKAAAFETTGLVLKLYREHFGVLPVVTECSSVYDTMAALSADRKTLTVSVVNPTLQPVRVPLEIKGAKVTGRGQRWQIAGSDPMACNDPDRGARVRIETTEVSGLAGQLSVAACSVTLFALELE